MQKRGVCCHVCAENICLYLLSAEPFVVLTNQQALKAAFAHRDIHGCMARWISFPFEYVFEIRYQSSVFSQAAEFLSRLQLKQDESGSTDEGDLSVRNFVGRVTEKDSYQVTLSTGLQKGEDTFRNTQDMNMINFKKIDDPWEDAIAELEPCLGGVARLLAGKPKAH